MYCRQGDISIESIEAMPEQGEQIKATSGRIILAYGEATGHHHSICADDVETALADGGAMFLKLCRDSVLAHQEHAPISLQAGNYRVTRQREYSPTEIRNVAD